MTRDTSKAKSCRPIQIFACNIPHSGIIDLTAKYLKEKIKLAFSHKNNTPGALLQSIKPFILGKSHDDIINPKQQKRLKRKYIYIRYSLLVQTPPLFYFGNSFVFHFTFF